MVFITNRRAIQYIKKWQNNSSISKSSAYGKMDNKSSSFIRRIVMTDTISFYISCAIALSTFNLLNTAGYKPEGVIDSSILMIGIITAAFFVKLVLVDAIDSINRKRKL